MKKLAGITAAMALAIVSTSAHASDFTGLTLSKGDIQTAMGWNNAAYTADLLHTTWTMNATASYSGDCEHNYTYTETFTDNGKGKTHTRQVHVQLDGTYSTSVSISPALDYGTTASNGKKIQTINSVIVQPTTLVFTGAPQVGGTCNAIDDETNVAFTGTLSSVTETLESANVVASFGTGAGSASYSWDAMALGLIV